MSAATGKKKERWPNQDKTKLKPKREREKKKAHFGFVKQQANNKYFVF